MEARFQSFKDFYPYYLSEHAKPLNRMFHFVGTLLVIILLIIGLVKNLKILWLLPFAGYGFAWFGHFFIEKNKPATFKYPFWSLMGDFLMFYHMATFQLKKHIKA